MEILQALFLYYLAGAGIAIIVGLLERHIHKEFILNTPNKYTAIIAFGPPLALVFLVVALLMLLSYPYAWVVSHCVTWLTRAPKTKTDLPVQRIEVDDGQWKRPN